MTDENNPEQEEPPKKSKLPLILGVLALVIGGGGGFFAVNSGLILGQESHEEAASEKVVKLEDVSNVAFIPVDPIIVTLRPGSANKHLSFKSQLEVPAAYREDVVHLLPRIVDVMNSYLSALETADFESPAIIVRLRSQLLRRVQIVAGSDRINDLLVMEFVLN